MIKQKSNSFKKIKLIDHMVRKFGNFNKKSAYAESLDPDGSLATVEIAAKNKENIIHTPRILKEGAFSWSLPEERKEYKYLTSSEPALRDLGLDPKDCEDEEYQKIVSGRFYLENPDFYEKGYPFPYATAYAGWQFGQFAGQLGDGRVLGLFDIPKKKGVGLNIPKYELQLKGAGKTPFSRFADGKAILRSSIREYIISEHLNALGIPTTRALSLTYLPKTYARRHKYEKCAIVSRFAESWVRFGNFDLYRWRSDRDGIRKLSDFVIKEYFTTPTVSFESLTSHKKRLTNLFDSANLSDELSKYDKMYLEIIIRNAETAALWQAYGFLNGVLNTDNTSILGLSLDFGPFSIMDRFDPNFTPNSEDREGRYSYSNTPTAIWWNLVRLGEDLSELIGMGNETIEIESLSSEKMQEWEERVIKRATRIIETGGEVYKYCYTRKFVEAMLNRLGISVEILETNSPEELRVKLIQPMLDFLERVKCDYNRFFLTLKEVDLESSEFNAKKWTSIIISSANLKEFEEDANKAELGAQIEKWLIQYKSFVSEFNSKTNMSRADSMTRYNPLFLPRNWILDAVADSTEASEGNDISLLKKLERMSFNPLDRTKWGDDLKALEEEWILQGDYRPDYAMLQCSCAS